MAMSCMMPRLFGGKKQRVVWWQKTTRYLVAKNSIPMLMANAHCDINVPGECAIKIYYSTKFIGELTYQKDKEPERDGRGLKTVEFGIMNVYKSKHLVEQVFLKTTIRT